MCAYVYLAHIHIVQYMYNIYLILFVHHMPSYCIHMCMWGAACTDGHICVRDDLDCCLDCSPG